MKLIWGLEQKAADLLFLVTFFLYKNTNNAHFQTHNLIKGKLSI